MSEAAVVAAFLDDNPDLEVVEVLVPDINNHLRGKWIEPAKLASLFAHKLKLPLSSLAFDIWGRDPADWVFTDGDADGVFAPAGNTLARVPWLERPTAQVLTSLRNADCSPCGFDPRTVVSLLEQAFGKLQMVPVLAVEMEFYLFRHSELKLPLHSQQTASGATPHGGQTYSIDSMQEMMPVLDGIRRACAQQNLPVDTLIKEAGVSQYEINLHHQRGALVAADQALLLQRVIRGVARQHDLHASFMAKPLIEEAGSGMHVHCSLENPAGDNLFADGTHQGSDLLRTAIAGVLSTLSDSMLLFAPHLNSYRRLQPGCHAPVTVSWGYDNRTVAVRVPNDDVRAIRIEHRVAGADASPHLVVAGLLSGLLSGIRQQQPPPDPVTGDAQDLALTKVPINWLDAIRCFEGSAQLLPYLGEEFVKVFALTKRQERAVFAQQISRYEYDTYL